MNCAYALLLAASTLSAREAKTEFTFQEISPSALRLSDGGQPVFVYNFGMVLAPGFPKAMERSCYLHPVYGPDGTVLTDDFNPDHPHHRGISWMWPDVRSTARRAISGCVKGASSRRFVRWKARETDGGDGEAGGRERLVRRRTRCVKEDVEISSTAWNDRRRSAANNGLQAPRSRPSTDRCRSSARRRARKVSAASVSASPPPTAAATKTVIRTEKGPSAKDGVLAQHRWAEIGGKFPGQAGLGRGSTTWKETPAIRTTAGCCDTDLDSSTCRSQG